MGKKLYKRKKKQTPPQQEMTNNILHLPNYLSLRFKGI